VEHGVWKSSGGGLRGGVGDALVPSQACQDESRAQLSFIAGNTYLYLRKAVPRPNG
jgi:hypothetical protein